jgi:hypothetical protein
MKITIGYDVLKIDKGKLTQTLDNAIRVQMRKGMKEYLAAAIVRVPVLTGMARGGFIPLGRWLRVRVDIPGARPKPSRNADIGASLAELDLSGFEYPNYNISYSINIVHFNINDPDNWRASAAGRKALEKYMQKEMPKALPKIQDFINRTSVSYVFGS